MPTHKLSGTNLEHASAHNQRVIFEAVRLHGPVSRAELARLSGLTPQAVANIAKRLLTAGLVVESGRRQGQRGQPAIELELDPDGGYSLGVNLDRDHMTIVAIDVGGAVRGCIHHEVSTAQPAMCLALIEAAMAEFLERRIVQPDRLLGLGVAMPDELGQLALPDLPEGFAAWRDFDLRAALAERTGLQVVVENDATAAAIGEIHYGHGTDHRNFFYILFSAGLGGGLVVNGQLVRGAHGRSGEIGFLPLGADRDGTSLQDAVSLSALLHHLRAAGHPVQGAGDLAALGPAAEGLLRDWLETAADRLLGPIAAIACLCDPHAILLGGRLPAPHLDRLAAAIVGRLERLRPRLPAMPAVRRAAGSTDAAALGAATLPLSEAILPHPGALMKRRLQA